MQYFELPCESDYDEFRDWSEYMKKQRRRDTIIRSVTGVILLTLAFWSGCSLYKNRERVYREVFQESFDNFVSETRRMNKSYEVRDKIYFQMGGNPRPK